MSASEKIKCKECNAYLTFAPGTSQLVCDYCGTRNEIQVLDEPIVAHSYEEHFETLANQAEHYQQTTVPCSECGSINTLTEGVISEQCPFCATPITLEHHQVQSVIKPSHLLPFEIRKEKAKELFHQWVAALWFAPNNLKQLASHSLIDGVYVPYWTYDTHASSEYQGRRGDHYYETESYTEEVEGKTVRKTRQVQRTRWTEVSGSLDQDFRDLLVCADRSLPQQYISALEPWDTERLVAFDTSFLQGFKASVYKIGMVEGFEEAKVIIDQAQRQAIKKEIGGDVQEIESMATEHSGTEFKHILLPLWISTYVYQEKTYRFLINARTGEVHGERPYSWVKIISLALVIFCILALLFVLAQHK